MPSPVYTSVTVGRLFYILSGMVGDRIATGTATSSSANLIDATAASQGGLALFDSDTDARILDKRITIWEGDQIGDSVRLNTYTAATFTAVPLPAFTGNLGTNSRYVIHERWSFLEYLEALIQAQRALTWDRGLKRGIFAETGSRREIMIGNALVNPLFDLYTTSNVADGWADANSTLTENTTVVFGGARRSLRVVTDGANVASLAQTIVGGSRWHDMTFEAWAWIWCETASEVFLRVNDGVDNHDSSTHGGTGWERLEVDVTVDNAVDDMVVSVRTTTAGSTITFNVQVVWVPIVPTDDHLYVLDADVNLIVLNGTLRASAGKFGNSSASGVNNFKHPIGPEAWDIVYDTTRAIRLKIDSSWNGRVLEYSGGLSQTALAAIGTTWAGPINALLNVAAAILLEQEISPRVTNTPLATALREALITDGISIPHGKLIEKVI